MAYLRFFTFFFILIPSIALAGSVNQCVNKYGKVTFADRPCEEGEKESKVEIEESSTKQSNSTNLPTRKIDGAFGISLGQVMPRHWKVEKRGGRLRTIDAPLTIMPPYTGAEVVVDPITIRICRIEAYIENNSLRDLQRIRRYLTVELKKDFGGYVLTPGEKHQVLAMDRKRLTALDESGYTSHIVVDSIIYAGDGPYSFDIRFIDDKVCAIPAPEHSIKKEAPQGRAMIGGHEFIPATRPSYKDSHPPQQ